MAYGEVYYQLGHFNVGGSVVMGGNQQCESSELADSE